MNREKQVKTFKSNAHEIKDKGGNVISHKTITLSPSGRTVVTLLMLDNGACEFLVVRDKKEISRPLIVGEEQTED